MDPTNPSASVFLLTIDVEDWFQVENFKPWISFSSWPSCELRVERNTHRLLDLLDSVSVKRDFEQTRRPDSIDPKATFFILGWVAERLPKLVHEIHTRGHEVASHGYCHELCSKQSHEDLKDDLVASKRLLEDTIGAPVNGYRAPSFSISHDILKIIQDSGYLYDSSYNSSGFNKRYGKLEKGWEAAKLGGWRACQDHGNCGWGGADSWESASPQPRARTQAFFELPISNLEIGSHVFPWGGGGYFRLIPFPLFKKGIESIFKKDGAYVFYMHPWEIDPEQPKMQEASRFFKFRHYVNLEKTLHKLEKLIQSFESCRFVTCSAYLNLEASHEAEGKAASAGLYEPSVMSYRP